MTDVTRRSFVAGASAVPVTIAVPMRTALPFETETLTIRWYTISVGPDESYSMHGGLVPSATHKYVRYEDGTKWQVSATVNSIYDVPDEHMEAFLSLPRIAEWLKHNHKALTPLESSNKFDEAYRSFQKKRAG